MGAVSASGGRGAGAKKKATNLNKLCIRVVLREMPDADRCLTIETAPWHGPTKSERTTRQWEGLENATISVCRRGDSVVLLCTMSSGKDSSYVQQPPT